MSYTGDSSVGGRVRDVEKDYAQRQTRLFRNFALVEGSVLLIVVVVVYVLGLVDPDVGVWVLAGVALIGGVSLSALLMQHLKKRAAALAQARGENPLF
ncbi:hypothetical protein [Microbacterium aurantiacum]|uniref:hypothetical protein n=1 Tax=Microbacterium aurantiacum TaxID=162393 RepID=UPI000C807827|nr:hypothetical protein [Microbacterium aurantiacum]